MPRRIGKRQFVRNRNQRRRRGHARQSRKDKKL